MSHLCHRGSMISEKLEKNREMSYEEKKKRLEAMYARRKRVGPEERGQVEMEILVLERELYGLKQCEYVMHYDMHAEEYEERVRYIDLSKERMREARKGRMND